MQGLSMLSASLFLLVASYVANAAYLDKREASSSQTEVPEYFRTAPEIYPGPTATGRTPFLAQSNPAPFGATRSFIANTPLETALPVVGDVNKTSIFRLMGQLSPYFPNPDGFGVQEYPLPPGANISQVHSIHRHGSRYPEKNSSVEKFGQALEGVIKGGAKFSGALSFLNSWKYGLGNGIIVPYGRQEMFDSGVLHYYDYGHLYNTSSKIIARTTTQDRMLKSAEYFLAGFFGLEWTHNATLEVIIEGDGFNNSLAGYDNCNNSNLAVAKGGTNASVIWQNSYLQNATKRFQKLSGDFKWNVSDVYNAQTLCPYETVAFGYSAFCDLFTYEEWKGFEYSIDLSFAGNNYFQSPTGRAVGIAYVEEVLARLHNHVLTNTDTQANMTLDNNTTTFPLNQSLYFDFSHDTNIGAVLTAFNLSQFAQFLPTDGPPAHQQLIVSHLQPFAARLDIEVITAPHPVSPKRTCHDDAYLSGPPTKYIHFINNQRTIPLGISLPACGDRSDGWCELDVFLKTQENASKAADYDYACNGDYPPVKYGTISTGSPR